MGSRVEVLMALRPPVSDRSRAEELPEVLGWEAPGLCARPGGRAWESRSTYGPCRVTTAFLLRNSVFRGINSRLQFSGDSPHPDSAWRKEKLTDSSASPVRYIVKPWRPHKALSSPKLPRRNVPVIHHLHTAPGAQGPRGSRSFGAVEGLGLCRLRLVGCGARRSEDSGCWVRVADARQLTPRGFDPGLVMSHLGDVALRG